jgi:hypothetical protein
VAGDEAQSNELDRAIDALYADDPAGFVAARDRLSAALRSAGRREEAREVAELRRPTLAAWAVDQVALASPERVDALVAAGERLRRAQEEAVSHGDRRALQRATDERRTVIAALVDEALAGLRRRGGADPGVHRDQIEATLEAASTDADLAALIGRGRLVTPVPRPAGFAGLLDLIPPPRSEAPAPRPDAIDRDPRRDDEENLERATEEATRLDQLAGEATGASAQAQAAAEEAAAAVERLEGELSEARARAATANERSRQAQAQAEAARAAAAGAAERLRQLEVET